MTDHDVFRMAKEASGLDQLCAVHGFLDALEEFARLVAAHEREACAQVCEETTAAWTQHLYNEGVMDCVKAIRARRSNGNSA